MPQPQPQPQRINQAKLISDVDLLVRDVLFGKIDINHVSIQLSKLYLPLTKEDDPELKYSPTIEAFRESTKKVMAASHVQNGRWGYYNSKQFIDYLQMHRSFITKQDAVLSEQKIENSEELEAYLRKLIDTKYGVLLVRVDIGYLKDTLHLVTIADFYRHLKKLRDFISNKKTCFKGLVGHVMALEQGYDHGYHCHLLLIYNGAHRQRDLYLGQAVGERWQDITEGQGSYYNCNNLEYKSKYEELGTLGIGKIRRGLPQEVENAVRTALYLTDPDKTDRCVGRLNQHLKVKPHGYNAFTHGIIKDKKRGSLKP